MVPTPAVSVVMPVRDCEAYIDAAVASVLAQDFEDFELAVLDDASTDSTLAKVIRWASRDPRIRYVTNPGPPLGLVGSSNAVVSASRANIIARLDGDDVCRTDRLSKQVAVLYGDPEVSVVGSLARGIDSAGKVIRPRDLRRLLPSYSAPPAPHSSWMFRRDAFEMVGGYPGETEGWEDKAFLHLMGSVGRVVVLPDSLVDIRYQAGGATVRTPMEDRTRLLVKERDFTNGDDHLAARSDAYRLRAALRVWAGTKPDEPAAYPPWGTRRWLSRSLLVGIYSTLGRLAPKGVRLALRAMIDARNLYLRRTFPDGIPVSWR